MVYLARYLPKQVFLRGALGGRLGGDLGRPQLRRRLAPRAARARQREVGGPRVALGMAGDGEIHRPKRVNIEKDVEDHGKPMVFMGK